MQFHKEDLYGFRYIQFVPVSMALSAIGLKQEDMSVKVGCARLIPQLKVISTLKEKSACGLALAIFTPIMTSLPTPDLAHNLLIVGFLATNSEQHDKPNYTYSNMPLKLTKLVWEKFQLSITV